MNALWAALLLVASVVPHAGAQSSADADPKGAGAVQAVHITATVEAVDQENRIVTLKNRQGDITAIRVGDDVRNLERLAPGDTVEIEYYEAVALDIKNTDAAPTATETTSVKRAKPGEKPGGMVKRKVRVVTEVMGVNPESQTLLVRGPLGNLTRIKVKDPARLAEFKIGGMIDVTYVEALAIAIRAAPPK